MSLLSSRASVRDDSQRLFESQRDVLNLAAKVDITAQSLNKDWILWAETKWGADVLSGKTAVSPDKADEFKVDINRYAPYRAWLTEWDLYYAKLRSYGYINLWSDYFREVKNWAEELDLWRDRYKAATAAEPSAPGIVIPSALPGVVPAKVPNQDPLGDVTTLVKWTVVGIGLWYGGKLLYSLAKSRGSSSSTPTSASHATPKSSELEPAPALETAAGSVAGRAAGMLPPPGMVRTR